MPISENGGSNGMVMPVAPMGYGGGTSGRHQSRNAMGQYKADGRSNRGGSYHSQDEMIQDMRERMQDADPETARAYRKVIRDMQDM